MKFSQNVENQVANPLYSFWGPVWDSYSENNEYVFRLRSPGYSFTIFTPIICIYTNATMSKVSLFRSSSFLGVLWEANMPFEKNHTWRGMKTKVSVKKYLVHTNFKRTVRRIILTGIIYSWSTLKRIRPIFQIFWRYLNIYY